MADFTQFVQVMGSIKSDRKKPRRPSAQSVVSPPSPPKKQRSGQKEKLTSPKAVKTKAKSPSKQAKKEIKEKEKKEKKELQKQRKSSSTGNLSQPPRRQSADGADGHDGEVQWRTQARASTAQSGPTSPAEPKKSPAKKQAKIKKAKSKSSSDIASADNYAEPDDSIVKDMAKEDIDTTQGKSKSKSKSKINSVDNRMTDINMNRLSLLRTASVRSTEYGFGDEDPIDDFNDPVPEVSRSNLTVEGELGQGAFGVVLKGKLKDEHGKIVACACKTLKDVKNKDAMEELKAEALLCWTLNHPNIVACLGQISNGAPAMLLLEFMSNGSLMSYLQDLPQLPRLQRLMKMSIDIARGMEHLTESGHIHRDLAARNVLVNEELECKVADFGLSRAIDENQYYQSEGGMVAIRWAAPEAYKYKKYSAGSDVWSYGIVLYEIWTKAAMPYGKKWTNMNVMLKVEDGFRLGAPPDCPKAVYQLMIQCWNPRRKLRPQFASIKERLQMAYDMLFPDDYDDGGYLLVPGADNDGEELEQLESLYIGLPVPTEDDIDNANEYEYQVTESVKPTAEIAVSKAHAILSKPDRFSPERLQSKRASNPQPQASIPAIQKFGKNFDLRKQEQAADVVKVAGDKRVEVAGVKSVKDVLALSRNLEVQSAAEETGLLVAKQEYGVDLAPSQWKESTGRALESVPTIRTGNKAGGKKRCTCRRAKCVCGARS